MITPGHMEEGQIPKNDVIWYKIQQTPKMLGLKLCIEDLQWSALSMGYGKLIIIIQLLCRDQCLGFYLLSPFHIHG